MYLGHGWSWGRVLALGVFQALGLWGLWLPWTWTQGAWALAIYLWFGLSTTLYLHRCLTHRALALPWAWRAFFALGTSVGQQGAPINWVGHHRWHHAKSDRPGEDVHSPQDGFAYGHAGWLLRWAPDGDAQMRRYAKEVADRDPYLWHLETPWRNLVPHVVVALLLWQGLGWVGLLHALYLPMTLAYHVTWSVNSFCHLPALGYRRYPTPDRSRNLWWVGILALGEGWHNNHHASPGRMPQGHRWYELDLTAGVVWLLERLGWATQVRWEAPLTGLARPEPSLPPSGTLPWPSRVAAQGEA